MATFINQLLLQFKKLSGQGPTYACYNMYAMTAAHPTLPIATRVRVKNLNNGRSVVVRINDRGPFLSNRLIDLSFAAAKKLGIKGIAPVEVEVV
nr:septal ring lytic transglycosylase RlpA family protein [Legionella pneumophila]